MPAFPSCFPSSSQCCFPNSASYLSLQYFHSLFALSTPRSLPPSLSTLYTVVLLIVLGQLWLCHSLLGTFSGALRPLNDSPMPFSHPLVYSAVCRFPLFAATRMCYSSQTWAEEPLSASWRLSVFLALGPLLPLWFQAGLVCLNLLESLAARHLWSPAALSLWHLSVYFILLALVSKSLREKDSSLPLLGPSQTPARLPKHDLA